MGTCTETRLDFPKPELQLHQCPEPLFRNTVMSPRTTHLLFPSLSHLSWAVRQSPLARLHGGPLLARSPPQIWSVLFLKGLNLLLCLQPFTLVP